MGAIFDSPISLIFLFIIYMIHPLMGLLALTGATLALVVALVTEKSVRPKLDDAMISARAARAELSESFKNIESAYASGIIKNRDKWKKFHKKYLLEQAYASNSQNNGTSLTKVVMMIQGSLLLGLGTLLAITGVMDIRAMKHNNRKVYWHPCNSSICPSNNGMENGCRGKTSFQNLEDF